ncbi:hypothetical protein OE88DRAFT_518314 [Heliocybe sulcata]|uniref:Protein kinase domain-containing protein n=1 Tax=Heliocybe sulcata TaxID=5364 RepID=A0A5C3MUB1_9AGAM|nr:hypothetical protein OE88DRAFT_518314 [Heliocybe sulcata]
MPLSFTRDIGDVTAEMCAHAFYGTLPHEKAAESAPAEIQLLGTPFGKGSETIEDEEQQAIPDLRKRMRDELRDTWVNGKKRFVETLVRQREDVPSEEVATAFLESYEGFDCATKTWKGLPVNPEKEDSAVYEALETHLNAILGSFGRASRLVVRTDRKPMRHCQGSRGGKDVLTMPDILMLGHGPAMTKYTSIQEPYAYSQCVAPIEAKIQRQVDHKEDRLQLAVYARECFVQQPNRRYVYALLITEETVRLYQFDRAGAMYSSEYKLGEDAVTFVQIVLAISTMNEYDLGLDDRIFWRDNTCYFDPSRTGLTRYRVLNPDTPFQRCAIRGRGTTCWHVEDQEDKDQFLAKFAWRTEERYPEWKHLMKVQESGLRHVGTIGKLKGQRIGTISESRYGIPLLAEEVKKRRPEVSDRVGYWISQPYYGPSLEYFDSVPNFLRAMYDVVLGSKELYSIGIIHRDISIQNALLDTRAESPDYGILIDLDMAVSLDRTTSGVKTDIKTGTRAFQSLKVLSGEKGYHTYLDELESVFWAFSYIACSYESPGVPKKPTPSFLMQWRSANVSIATLAKQNFLENKNSWDHIAPGMGTAVPMLFDQLQDFFLAVTEGVRAKLRSKTKAGKARDDQKRQIEQRRRQQAQAVAVEQPLALPELSEDERRECRCSRWLDETVLKHYKRVLDEIAYAVEVAENPRPSEETDDSGDGDGSEADTGRLGLGADDDGQVQADPATQEQDRRWYLNDVDGVSGGSLESQYAGSSKRGASGDLEASSLERGKKRPKSFHPRSLGG